MSFLNFCFDCSMFSFPVYRHFSVMDIGANQALDLTPIPRFVRAEGLNGAFCMDFLNVWFWYGVGQLVTLALFCASRTAVYTIFKELFGLFELNLWGTSSPLIDKSKFSILWELCIVVGRSQSLLSLWRTDCSDCIFSLVSILSLLSSFSSLLALWRKLHQNLRESCFPWRFPLLDEIASHCFESLCSESLYVAP